MNEECELTVSMLLTDKAVFENVMEDKNGSDTFRQVLLPFVHSKLREGMNLVKQTSSSGCQPNGSGLPTENTMMTLTLLSTIFSIAHIEKNPLEIAKFMAHFDEYVEELHEFVIMGIYLGILYAVEQEIR